MLGDVDRRAAIFAAERKTLEQAQADQRDRGGDSPGRVVGQQADGERAEAHQRHGDQEGVLAADQVAEAAEEQRAEWPDGEAGGEGEQGEDERRRRIDAGEELRGEDRRERAVDVEVVPLEHGTERRGEYDHPFLGGHRAFLVYRSGYRCHGRPSLNVDYENSPAHVRSLETAPAQT